MKAKLEQAFTGAFLKLQSTGRIDAAVALPRFAIERSKSAEHGDFACNLAMLLAKSVGVKPRDLATELQQAVLSDAALNSDIAKLDIAGPGFINVFLRPESTVRTVLEVLDNKSTYGQIAGDKKVTVEFVSANPTGPLHVGHGRGAAYGSTLSNILKLRGNQVHREYYVNDNGRQMDILAVSIWMRYLERRGEAFRFPDNAYRGQYIYAIAEQLDALYGATLQRSAAELMADLPLDESEGGDKEKHIDARVARCKTLLGSDDYERLFRLGCDSITDDIRDDLLGFGVEFDRWFSERSLATSGALKAALDRLEARGHLYQKDGATWFKASEFGDEKDRVVLRDNGQATYFASDVAYLLDKLNRGFERLIYVFGADHHGYVARLKGCAEALGEDPNRVEVKLIQFAVLYRGNEKVQMSTRSGEFVTLRELRDEVGRDACRFFYVMRSHDQHLDFDLDLAVQESNENPVYYVQMAHARIGGVERQLKEKQYEFAAPTLEQLVSHLADPASQTLVNTLSRYGEVLDYAAHNATPHSVAYYVRDIANDFHSFYDANKVIVEDAAQRNSRLALAFAAKQVLANALATLGVSAPEKM
jgi:arginyl-tRNA synthetase